MWTAKINRKEETKVGLQIFVDMLKDDVVHHTENVIPQDRAGFDYWLKDRLKTLNEGQVLKDTLVDGAEVEPPAEPEAPTPTAKQLAKADFDASVAEYKYIKEMNAILPAVFTQWMLDNQVVICQQKYQTWQNTQ